MTEFDLKTLGLTDGTHEITVVAKASGYKDSQPSNAVQYVVGEETQGYTVRFVNNELTNSDDEQYAHVDGQTIRLFHTDTDYEDVFIDEKSWIAGAVSLTYTNVIGVQLLAAEESFYTAYVMGGIESYLYHQGGGNNSAYLELTDDITIDIDSITQNCITADTLVTMADGTQKAIGDIEVGDEILSYDWNTMELIPNKVIYSSKHEAKPWTAVRYFKRTFSDGTIIKNAFAHRFYNLEDKMFTHLDFWDVGDHAYKSDGTFPELVKVETVYESCYYSRITGELGTNYFANGLLTGNSECPKDLDMSKLT